MSEVLCPHPGLPAQERYGAFVVHPEENYEDDKKTGALLQRQSEEAGHVQSRGALRRHHCVLPIFNWRL